jgi:hypothetical protein
MKRICLLSTLAMLMAATGCKENTPRQAAQLSQKEAAIVMVGTCSNDAFLMLMLGQRNALVSTPEEAQQYLDAAQFGKETAGALKKALKDAPATDLALRQKAWNEMNGKLTEEAKSVSPAWGADCILFGIGLRHVSRAFTLFTSNSSPAEGVRDMSLKLARMALASDFAQIMFKSGRKLPLPEKMKKALAAIETADTSTIEKCRACASQLSRLLKMMKAVAEKGQGALDQFPDE